MNNSKCSARSYNFRSILFCRWQHHHLAHCKMLELLIICDLVGKQFQRYFHCPNKVRPFRFHHKIQENGT